MRKELHHEPRCIMLPASVLDVLKDMPASSLKVLIYLCSCNQGQPLAASGPTIAGATGIKARSVISAVDFLCERKLITCISGSGNQPNQYCVPLPAPQQAAALPTNETIASPNPGLTQATSPAAIPAQAPIWELITDSDRPLDDQEFAKPGSDIHPNQDGIPLPARKQNAKLLTNDTTASPSPELRQAMPPAATPARVPIRALVTECYRSLDDQEFAELQKAHSDESVLREKLERCGPGGVDAHLSISFFLAAIDKPSPR